MEYALLGSTGVKVSRICVGTATFGVAPIERDADRVVHAALDLGINFFDTANVYGILSTFDRPGAPPAAEREPAERILGRALAGRRDDVVIATKSCVEVGPGVNDRGLSRRHIIQQVENSLRRLETDYIDLYYAHNPDPDTPLEQTLSVYDDLVRQGKLRYIALSNHPAWQLTHALWIADDRRLQAPVCAQVKYNLIDRAAERELVPACLKFGLSSCRSLRCTAGCWPACRSWSGSSSAMCALRGPGSPRRSCRSAARSSGSARTGDCGRIKFRLPGCCPARPSHRRSSAPKRLRSSRPTLRRPKSSWSKLNVTP